MPVVVCSSSSALSSEISAAISINDGFLPFPDGRCCVVFDCGVGRWALFAVPPLQYQTVQKKPSREADSGFSCVSTPSLLL